MGEESEEENEDKKEEKEEEKKDEDLEENDNSTFMKFFKEFGKNLKLGCQEDDSNRSKLSKLLRFHTTKTSSQEKYISLENYLERMQENQESIYYMSGESLEVMQNASNLQVFKKKNLEVLLLDDTLDEGCFQRLSDFEGKKFVSVQKADLELGETDEEKVTYKKLTNMYEPLT